MATYNKFNNFVEAVAEKTFDLQNDTLRVALTDTAPVATNSVLTDITEIDYTNCSDRTITVTSSSQTSGTYKLVLTDLTLTASGTVGPFRYVVIYDDTATNDELIAWYDKGSEVTLQNGDTFTVDFDDTNGFFTLA